uniref:NAD(P)-binding domain-containing protein n=1 Tax=Eutreptiella gymnastica TaxID=73025 RepID=A0A7S4FRG7_9EUGL
MVAKTVAQHSSPEALWSVSPRVLPSTVPTVTPHLASVAVAGTGPHAAKTATFAAPESTDLTYAEVVASPVAGARTQSSVAQPWGRVLLAAAMAGVLGVAYAYRRSNGSVAGSRHIEFSCCVLVNGQELKTVVVTGATGRTGQLVIKALLERADDVTVKALVRDPTVAREKLQSLEAGHRLKLVACNLENESQVSAVCSDADAVVWCASGFTSGNSLADRVKKLVGQEPEKKDIDSVALPVIAEAMKLHNREPSAWPRVVMLSSAGVTRPVWPEEKKQRLIGAADIPIVRLNPFGVLDRKRAAEQMLRDSGASYTIVRPTGLNDEQAPGRPIFSQGDVAVGRISRSDVADVLVRMLLDEAGCMGKTFEVVAMPDLAKPQSYEQQLTRLVPDTQALDEVSVEAQYNILQQLLPGETLQPNKLAMGQTYEQLDKGETGRLGERGQEKIPTTPFGRND